MGNNESLPPPPPPGQPPVPSPPPAGPPAYPPPPPPGYNPPAAQFPPTTQFPVTQPLPPTQAFPGGPPGGFPPGGSTAFEPPPEPPKKKTGLIVAGGLVAVAAIVAVVLVLTGGDDKTVSPATTFPENTVFVTIPDITFPDITFPPDETLDITVPVITQPEVTEPAITDPPVTEPVVQTTVLSGGVITDDLGVFTVVLPDGLAVDSTPLNTQDNFTLPSVTGAVDVEGFYSDDVTPGMTVLVVGEDVDSNPAAVLTFLEPADGICTGREETADYPTTIGPTTLLKLDGCGPDATAAKVLLVAAIPNTTSIVAFYLQGPGKAVDLLPQAQTVFESVRLL